MRRMILDRCGEKDGDKRSGGEGGSIRHGSDSHGAGIYGSSSDVVVSQSRDYYQLEARVKNLKEELSQIHGDRCRVTPVVLLAPMLRYIGRFSVLRGWDEQYELK